MNDVLQKSNEPRLQQYISFFRECYEADNRELGLWNVFRDKHWHLWFPRDHEELINGAMPRIPVAPDVAEAAYKSQRLYERERSLLYTSCYVAGNVQEAGRKRVICAPLLIYEAHLLEEDGDWYLHIDPNDENINYPLVRWLRDRSGNEDPEPTLDLAGETLGQAGPSAIAPWLESLLPEIDCLELFRFPVLKAADTLDAAAEKGVSGKLSVHAASAMVLVARSPNTRGILHELSLLEDTKRTSNAMAQLLTGSADRFHPGPASNPEEVPGLLNAAQERALQLAAENSLSLVVGPPGTGKSYTIAAMAIDRMAHGESVLIVSNTEQAVDVVGQKITDNLSVSDCVVRAGRGDYLREFKRYVDDLLHGLTLADDSTERARALTKEAKSIGKRLAGLERDYERRCRRSLSWGRTLAEGGDGLFRRFHKRYVHYRIRNGEHHWELISEIMRLQERREEVVSELIDARHQIQRYAQLGTQREMFVAFSKGIRARASSRQQAMFDAIDMKVLLKAFPIWLCSLESLHKVLPLDPAMFDLLIIDEATQCDVASCLPAMHRAERAIVVGDPKQLRHVSFLSRERERKALERSGLERIATRDLSHRDNSILDLVNQALSGQDQLVLLDEHYRGKPSLIEFSNQHFYKSALRIMSERPDHGETQSLKTVAVSGSRDKRGVNRKEADAVIELANSLIEDDAERGRAYSRSIGILSPFREQAAHLGRLIERRFSAEVIEAHKLRSGTAYAFQGDERDIMLLSFAVDDDVSGGAIGYLNRADMFNVAITRARDEAYLFHSLEPTSLKPDSLLRLYLEFADDAGGNSQEILKQAAVDGFLKEVSAWLISQGVTVWSGYSVAGFGMDIVCKHGDRMLAIDLIGFPGELTHYHNLERLQLFQRANLSVYPLSFGSWKVSRERCERDLNRLLKLMSDGS